MHVNVEHDLAAHLAVGNEEVQAGRREGRKGSKGQGVKAEKEE